MVEGSNSNPASSGVDVAVTVPATDGAKAAKTLARRMLQGYQIASVKCTDCGVPMMSHWGIVRCVVCVEELISVGMDKEPSYKGSGTETRTARRESRNEENDGESWRTARSVINVTEDGIELSPGGILAAIEECDSDEIERMLYILDDETQSDEPSSSGWVSGTMSSRAECEDGDDEISHKKEALMISAMPVSGSAHSQSSHEVEKQNASSKLSYKAEENLFSTYVEARSRVGNKEISQETVGSGHQQLAQKMNEMSACSGLLSEGGKGRGEGELSNTGVEAGNAHLLEAIDEHTRQIQQLRVQQAPADNKESNSELVEELSQRSAGLVSEMSAQATTADTITLECSEDQVKSAGHGNIGVSLVPSKSANIKAADPAGSTMTIKAPTLTIEAPAMKNTTNVSSGIPKSSETTAATTATSPPELQKRMTINSLAKEHSASGKKFYMPAWEKSVKNFVFNDETSLIDSCNEQPPVPPGGKETFYRDEFFEELRHRALLIKATRVQEKLEASSYVTKRKVTLTATPPMQVERNDNNDRSAIESPLFSSNDASCIHDAINNLQDQSEPTSKLIIPPPKTAKSRKALDDSTVPFDEKKPSTLKCIREAKAELPFDENTNASLQISTLLSAETSSFSVPCEMARHPTATSNTGDYDNTQSCHGATSITKIELDTFIKDEKTVEKEVVMATPVVPSAAVSVSSHSSLISIASLSSSVQMQQTRIAQFEADALRKHREAELAAASAREALNVLVKARNDRREKIKARAQLRVGENKSAPMRSNTKKAVHDKTADKTELQVKDAKQRSTPCHDGDIYSTASASQYSRNGSSNKYQHRRYDTIGSNDANRESVTQQFGDDGDGVIIDTDGESTINDYTSDQITTSSSYLSELRRSSDKRQRNRIQRSHRWRKNLEAENDYHPVTPEAESNHCTMRISSPGGHHEEENTISESIESKSSIADSISSKSTLSTFDTSGKRPSQFTRARHYAHEDISRHHRSKSASNIRRSEKIVTMKPHLLLPSLSSPDSVDPVGTKVSFESFTMPRRTVVAVQQPRLQHHHRSQPIPSWYDFHHDTRSSVARAPQSMKPNHLLPYSIKGGFINDATPKGARLIEVKRPASLSRRTESEPFSRDHHHQRPMMSQQHRELHYSDSGYTNQEIMAREQQPSGNLQPMIRDFDQLSLAQRQMIEERMAYMSQEIMAQEQQHSGNPHPTTRDFDLLAQHEMIGQRIASANQDTRRHNAPISAGYHHPTIPLSLSPQTLRFGNNYERSRVFDSVGGHVNVQQQPWQYAQYN